MQAQKTYSEFFTYQCIKNNVIFQIMTHLLVGSLKTAIGNTFATEFFYIQFVGKKLIIKDVFKK